MNRRAMDPKSQLPARLTRSLILLAGAAMLSLSACSGGASSEAPPLEGAAIGGDFTLVDKTGKTVHAADFAGRYRAIYFGYTFCPDVCPTDVQRLMLGFHRFGKANPKLAGKVAPIFVSIDPERDTPQVVGQFAAHFGPELTGLTGSAQQVAQVAKSYAVYYKKGETTAPNVYFMDHSSAAYLMGPDGKPIALLPIDVDDQGKSVAAELAKWVH